tara:strand:+ start:304 stop:699 length:396 start_codon:yes stop_codon:yes gene_type:complete
MASELRVDTLKDSSGNNSVGMAYVSGGSAKVLVHFDASSGTPTTQDSLNVSSLGDDGVAITQCNFTNNLDNDNYYFSGSISNNVAVATMYNTNPDTLTTSSVDIRSKYATSSSVGLSDYNGQVGVIHGDLA